MPSGVDATTGVAHEPSIRAAVTLTLAVPKSDFVCRRQQLPWASCTSPTSAFPHTLLAHAGIDSAEGLFTTEEIVPVSGERREGHLQHGFLMHIDIDKGVKPWSEQSGTAKSSPRATTRSSSRATTTSRPTSVEPDLLKPSTTTTVCPWKGRASYHTLVVDGKENNDAAWYYPTPTSAASAIAGRIAFWHGVKIEDDGGPAPRRSILDRSHATTEDAQHRRTRPRRGCPVTDLTDGTFFESLDGHVPSSTSGRRGADRARRCTRSSIILPTTTRPIRSTSPASTSTRTPASRPGSA